MSMCVLYMCIYVCVLPLVCVWVAPPSKMRRMKAKILLNILILIKRAKSNKIEFASLVVVVVVILGRLLFR